MITNPLEFSADNSGAPPTKSMRLARQHAQACTSYLAQHEGRFNLLDYLYNSGPMLIDLLKRYSHREIYRIFTQERVEPIPVSYSYFTRTLALYREQRGLPPSRQARRHAAPTVDAHPIDSAKEPLIQRPTAGPNPTASAKQTKVAAASVKVTQASSVDVKAPVSSLADPVEDDPYDYFKIRPKMFPPFTKEDAYRTKPIAEVALERQMAELDEFEKQLRANGSST